MARKCCTTTRTKTIKNKVRRVRICKIIVWCTVILAQIFFWVFAYGIANTFLPYWKTIALFVSGLVVLYIVNKQDNPAYKLAWVIFVLVAPFAGGMLYILLEGNRTRRRFVQRARENQRDTLLYVPKDDEIQREIQNVSQSASAQTAYISRTAGYPVYKDTYVKYFALGEDNFEILIQKLEQAKHFIFMEYFIIKKGYMWDKILNILKQKAEHGLDVRLLYDDFGCSMGALDSFSEELKVYGIQAVAFNPLTPVISLRQNNRDHRKITVIDGWIGFTGGMNLADEYINKEMRFGHWKDTGVMLLGPAVWNLTLMFLQNWHMTTGQQDDFRKYIPERYIPGENYVYAENLADETKKNKPGDFFTDLGFVQPYGDTPVDDEIVGESVYLNLIHRAKRYIYITTPYLILDNEMISALCLAVKSGIDVRIILPGIPDKKLVYLVTQSYYYQLIQAGVRIYQYTPGFVHAKTVVADDQIATVGTVNFDYRSFFLHFECGVWIFKNSVIYEIREDFMKTLQACKEITEKDIKNTKRWKLFWQSMLRLVAPLM